MLDEADRMIETGHFAELENILRLTLRGNKFVFTRNDVTYAMTFMHREEEIPGEFNDMPAEAADVPFEADGLQIFVFSATLSKDLQRNLRKRTKLPKKGQKPTSTLGTSPESI